MHFSSPSTTLPLHSTTIIARAKTLVQSHARHRDEPRGWPMSYLIACVITGFLWGLGVGIGVVTYIFLHLPK